MDPADLDLDCDRIGICGACLSLVSTPGDAQRMTPILWDERLREPALAASAQARRRGGARRPGEERARRWWQAMQN